MINTRSSQATKADGGLDADDRVQLDFPGFQFLPLPTYVGHLDLTRWCTFASISAAFKSQGLPGTAGCSPTPAFNSSPTLIVGKPSASTIHRAVKVALAVASWTGSSHGRKSCHLRSYWLFIKFDQDIVIGGMVLYEGYLVLSLTNTTLILEPLD